MDTMFSLCLYDRLCIIVINLWTELAPGWLAGDCIVGRLAQVAPFEPASRCANPHPDASCEFAKVGRLASESCGFAMASRLPRPADRHYIHAPNVDHRLLTANCKAHAFFVLPTYFALAHILQLYNWC